MAKNSKIEWCTHSWNPWIGCAKVSPGCDHCYAEVSTPARSMKVIWGVDAERHITSESNWNMPLRWNRQHDKYFAEHGQRQRVFCASLADVFDNHPDVEQPRARLFELIKATPNLDWLLLTKRIGNAKKMLPADWGDGYPNVRLGSSVVNQPEADREIGKLITTPARSHFLSMEPLLGPVILPEVFLKKLHFDGKDHDYPDGAGMIDWVIVGGESGAHARPMHPDWGRSLRDQCKESGTPFLFKQWGEWLPFDQREAGQISNSVQYQSNEFAWKVGKKAAGRMLDGVIHDGYPRSEM